jgi:agmatine/peptidylarginine deiminase
MMRRHYPRPIILLALLGFCTRGAIAEEDLESTIDYLLAYVKNADVVFIRNDREHTSDEAAAHMQRKYEHFKDQIKTPEDFIRLAGTKSLMTGKAYQIRMKDGKTMLTQKWLEDALEKYRTKGGLLK